jgi:hypothetical protein
MKERDYKALRRKIEKARIEIKEKSIELIEVSNTLKNETATLTRHLEATQIETKQVTEENNNLRYILQLAGPKKEKAV